MDSYVRQSARIMWNFLVASDFFSITNGVNQRGVISPIMLNLYLYNLLNLLKQSGICCHIITNWSTDRHRSAAPPVGERCSRASNFMVSDNISDHLTLHASLACYRPHPEKKKMFVGGLRCINNDSLGADLAGININIDCEDVNVVLVQYDTSLSRLLDNLAH